jgi:hypothetical protein
VIRIEPVEDRALSVHAGGVEILRYVYRPDTPPFEAPKPYLHPVRTLAGDVVTGYRPHDHRWHKGVQMTASHLSGQNFWGGGSWVRDQGYLDLPNLGTMRHGEFTAVGAQGWTELLSWHTQQGDHWIDERRSMAVRDVEGGSWALEFTTELTNVRGAPLDFGSPPRTAVHRPATAVCSGAGRGASPMDRSSPPVGRTARN